MGDMADYYFSQGTPWCEDPDLGHFPRRSTRRKTCRCCGEKGLRWVKKDGKWLLGNAKREIHHCPTNPYQPDFPRPGG